VDDRRARLKALEIAQDRGRVGQAAPPTPLLPGARAKQLRFGEQHERRRAQRHTAQITGHDDGEPRVTVHELLPAVHAARRAAVGDEHLRDHFAPARGVRGQQHPPWILLEEGQQRCERLSGAGVEPEIRGARQPWSALSAEPPPLSSKYNLRMHRQLRTELRRTDKYLSGASKAARCRGDMLVARADRLPGGAQRGLESRFRGEHQVGGQVIHEAGGRREEQRQVILDAGRRNAFTDAAVEVQPRDIAREAQPETPPVFAHRVRIERNLACRQQAQRVDGFQ